MSYKLRSSKSCILPNFILKLLSVTILMVWKKKEKKKKRNEGTVLELCSQPHIHPLHAAHKDTLGKGATG